MLSLILIFSIATVHSCNYTVSLKGNGNGTLTSLKLKELCVVLLM